ncbi:MAG: hypothetical protein KGJ13_11630, partial [Patescibacteria group bacterium]|nr:hypothetical protein [Patescibacteria group bacterium]
MRRKPNRIGLTLTDYRNALNGYKNINTWAIWGYNNSVPLVDVMSSFLSYKKQKREPLRRTRRIGISTLQNGIKNDCNKVVLRWARKRMMPEARQWLLARFPHTAEAIKQSEISHSAGAIPLYTQEDIKPGVGIPQTIGSMIEPGYEGLWEKHQAE